MPNSVIQKLTANGWHTDRKASTIMSGLIQYNEFSNFFYPEELEVYF